MGNMLGRHVRVCISSAYGAFLGCLCCNPLSLKGKGELTYNLDDLGQEHSVGHILLEVLDEAFVAGFSEVMIGPIRVDLQRKHTGNFRNLGRAHCRVRGNCWDLCLGATVAFLLAQASWRTPELPEPLIFSALCGLGIQLAVTVLSIEKAVSGSREKLKRASKHAEA